MPENSNNDVPDINSGRPYKRAARAYLRKGWLAPLPLPPRAKEKPPDDFTGRGAPYPGEEQIDDWIDRKPTGNISLRMPPIEVDGKPYDVIGIDVDDYVSGGKTKQGGLQLRRLEKRLGKLPATMRSTSRGADNVSGIRFYLAPAGHLWRGKLDKDIDIVSPGYRYAVVWPSWHPEARQYIWINDVDGTEVDSVQNIPDPALLPMLPEAWFDLGTNEGMIDTGVDIDMETGNDGMRIWMRKALPGRYADSPTGMCKEMAKRLQHWKDEIDGNPSSHDKITGAHWNLVQLAKEGHGGLGIALQRIELYYKKDTIRREKRTPSSVTKEIWRSKINCLRKLKAEVDKAKSDGIDLISTSCVCLPEDDGDKDTKGKTKPRTVSGVPIRTKGLPDPDEYERNDDGNAQHWLDLLGEGNVHYVQGLGVYMFWTGTKWQVDDNGLARRTFWEVRKRQKRLADNLKTAAVTAAKRGDEAQAKQYGAEAKVWQSWADRSGNNLGANAALEAAQVCPGVSISADDIDARTDLLAVANGIVELMPENPDNSWRIRPMERTDLITTNTGIPLLERRKAEQWLKEHPLTGRTVDPALGEELWRSYLDKFLPDTEIQMFLQKVFGYGLLGDNRERLCVFLYGETTTGKSMLLDVVMSALGQYADVVNLNILKDRQSGLNPELAQAFPLRIVTASEVSGANRMHADVFKRVTGNDKMSAELKNQNVIIRKRPAFLVVIATNAAPTIPGADEALKKRLCVIPFTVRVPDDEEDTSIAAELSRHGGPAVLRWLVEGFEMYAREGLQRGSWPLAVRSYTESFHAELSDIGMYLSERVRRKKGAELPVAALYADFQEWCAGQNIDKIPSQIAFGKQVPHTRAKVRLGAPGAKKVPEWCWLGIELGRPARNMRVVKRAEK